MENYEQKIKLERSLEKFQIEKSIKGTVAYNMEQDLIKGLSQEEVIEKARSGVYANTSENKKKGRIGQKYGGKKEEEGKKEPGEKKFDESKLKIGSKGGTAIYLTYGKGRSKEVRMMTKEDHADYPRGKSKEELYEKYFLGKKDDKSESKSKYDKSGWGKKQEKKDKFDDKKLASAANKAVEEVSMSGSFKNIEKIYNESTARDTDEFIIEVDNIISDSYFSNNDKENKQLKKDYRDMIISGLPIKDV